MNSEKISVLKEQRAELSNRNRALKNMSKYHKQKMEDCLKDAQDHMKKMKSADEERTANNKIYFDKGTELEELTGEKRIDYLR